MPALLTAAPARGEPLSARRGAPEAGAGGMPAPRAAGLGRAGQGVPPGRPPPRERGPGDGALVGAAARGKRPRFGSGEV